MTDRRVPRLYLDTNVFIGAFENDAAASKDLRELFFDLEEGPGFAATSELTLAELAAHGEARMRFYHGLLVSNTFINLLPVTQDLLIAAGTYRHRCRKIGRSVKLPDAIHIMTADRARCDLILSADKRLCVPTTIKLIAPSIEGLAFVNKSLDA